MSRKESVELLKIQVKETTSNKLAHQAARIVEEAAMNCFTGNLISFDYLGSPVEALEIDLKKFVFTMRKHIVLN